MALWAGMYIVWLPMNSDLYLNAKSHHHTAQKKVLIRILVIRAQQICSNYLNDELKHLKAGLLRNGYKLNEKREVTIKQLHGDQKSTQKKR